ncbi:unnamed protein product [Meloidogyne enterolobii]|uniref:Uncharacterized protein n=1 Tax=Meloidogyne enterolobii TaxID=390850 RepID=A0ACB0ZJM9_MELEN
MANLIIYRINISNIVKYIYLIYEKFIEIKLEYEDKFNEFWNLNIFPAAKDLLNEDKEIKEIIKIYKLIFEILINKYKELIKEREEEEEGEVVIKIEEKLKFELGNKIIEIAKNNKKFKEFLDTTRGAKARILEIFEREMDIYEIIFEEENGDLREIISIGMYLEGGGESCGYIYSRGCSSKLFFLIFK